MAITDWIQTAAAIYFAWQQNQIFKRQNAILAAQGGQRQAAMPFESSRFSWLKRYWPTVVMILLFLLTAYDVYDRHTRTRESFTRIPLAQMEHVEGLTFPNEPVDIDGKYFIRCHFDNARLVFRGEKDFALTGNGFNGPIVFHTDNQAAKHYASLIVQLQREIGLVDQAHVGFTTNDDIVLQKLNPPPGN